MALVPPALILLVFAASAARDNDANCAHWAEIGECDKNPKFMQKECAKSCSMSERDTADQAECSRLVKEGRCHADVALVRCRASCYTALKANLTEDLEGNCFYWATDGECESNREWMATSCRRSCELLRSCGVAPESTPRAHDARAGRGAGRPETPRTASVATRTRTPRAHRVPTAVRGRAQGAPGPRTVLPCVHRQRHSAHAARAGARTWGARATHRDIGGIT